MNTTTSTSTSKRRIATLLIAGAMMGSATTGAALAYNEHREHQRAANWAVDNGIMQGDENGQLNLNDPLTRGQAATMLLRYTANVVQPEEDEPGWDCYTMGNKQC